MTPLGPAAALTAGVGSPGLAPVPAAGDGEVAMPLRVVEVEDVDAEASCVIVDWSLPARRLASLRVRSRVADIVLASLSAKNQARVRIEEREEIVLSNKKTKSEVEHAAIFFLLRRRSSPLPLFLFASSFLFLSCFFGIYKKMQNNVKKR